MADSTIASLTQISSVGTSTPFAVWDSGGPDTKKATLKQIAERVLYFSPATLADGAYEGLTLTATAGTVLSLGHICYLKSDGKFWPAKGDSALTMPAKAVSTATINQDASGTFLLRGFVKNSGWDFPTPGAPLYVDDVSAGLVTASIPDDAGDQVQIVGYASSVTDTIFFDPNLLIIEVGTGQWDGGTLYTAILNNAYQGITLAGTAGVTLSLWDVVYLDTDSNWQKAIATSTSFCPALAITCGAADAGSPCNVLLKGSIRNDSWSALVTGNKVYLSKATAGGITCTSPASTGDQVQILGWAQEAKVMWFEPNPWLVEVS